jgi:hypothetical protein
MGSFLPRQSRDTSSCGNGRLGSPLKTGAGRGKRFSHQLNSVGWIRLQTDGFLARV